MALFIADPSVIVQTSIPAGIGVDEEAGEGEGAATGASEGDGEAIPSTTNLHTAAPPDAPSTWISFSG